jgi:CubicO group peptidase (beta-lactamase class C family)
MKSFPLLILLLSCFFVCAQKKTSDNRLAGIDAQLESILTDWKAAGFAVAVVEKNKVVYAKGFGFSDYEKKVPVTTNTLFAIGSCSKAFTSSILGLLKNESKVDFDKSPSEYIPQLSFFNNEMNTNITVRDLMCHRTGLPRHDYSWYLFNTDSRDSLLQRVKYQEPTFGVRHRWQYNNFMFLAQGVIAEKVTGETWEKNVSERLFKPLNMTRSNLSIAEMEKSTDVALGYEVKNDKEIVKTDYYHIRGMAPAGSINSSVNEMSNWVMTWINGGKFNGKEVLPASYVTEAMSSQMVIGAALPSKEHPDIQFANYGYGWFMASYKGHYRVEHGGNIDGFSASTCFFPSDSVGVVVLVNQNGSTVPAIVRNTIVDRMLGLSRTDWGKELKVAAEKNKKQQAEEKTKSVSSNKKGTKTSHAIEDFEGKYTHPGYGTLNLVVRNDSLFANMPRSAFWLKHAHYDIFQPFEIGKHGIDTAEASQVRFNFHTGNMGDIESALISGMEQGLKPLVFERTPATTKITPEELKKYVGEYALGEMVLKIYVKTGETLYAFVQGQPEYELRYLGQHKFGFKTLPDFKMVFIESAGAFDAISVIQPNGTFKAVRKK